MTSTTYKTNIQKYFTRALILVLIIIIFIQRCGGDVIAIDKSPVTVIHKTDTLWRYIRKTEFKEVPVVEIRYLKPNTPEYTSGESIDTCKFRFNELVKAHTIARTYKDVIKIDTIGTLTVIDTVFLNKLYKRTYVHDYKIPTIIDSVTIIKPYVPKRQFYIGGNVFGDKNQLQLITPGVMYKDRKDRVYQANLGINFDGTVTYGVGAYWKIKFKN